MSKLKTIGRDARRLRKMIAKMDPKKVYRIADKDNAITLTGAQWKESTKNKHDEQAEANCSNPEANKAQDAALDVQH